MKFYCIHRSGPVHPSTSLLKHACEQQGVEFVELVSDSFDFANPIELDKKDLLYRVSTDSLSRQLEKLLLTMNPTTFYSDSRGFWWQDNVVKATAVHLANGVPINKTVFGASSNIELLKNVVNKLEGFPIIIKVSGGSHGIGVIRVDSLPSLVSVIDYIKATSNEQFILRQYVEHTSHARLIVLGDEVIDSIEYTSNEGDFRTNAGSEPNVKTKDFGDNINSAAVKAVNVLGLEFGGVDIIIDKAGDPHVLEVNFPCFFPRAQKISGIDIAQKMVTYLTSKAESN